MLAPFGGAATCDVLSMISSLSTGVRNSDLGVPDGAASRRDGLCPLKKEEAGRSLSEECSGGDGGRNGSLLSLPNLILNNPSPASSQ